MDNAILNSSEIFYFVQIAIIIVFLLIITFRNRVKNRYDD